MPDDEEEEPEVEMEQVASVGPPPIDSRIGGGFLQNFSQPSGSGGGGGFEPEDALFTQPRGEGGFFADAQEDQAGTGASLGGSGGGGFMPMDTDATFEAEPFGGGGGGGGFLPAEPFPSFSAAHSTNLASGSGGFFPDSADINALDSLNAVPSLSGGFLPQLPNLEFEGLDSLALPTPPRPARIPLARVPGALRTLGVPRGSEKEVMEMFEEVASDDENVEGGKSVRRERFVEALEVLLDDQGDVENGEDDEEGDDGSEEEEYNDQEEEPSSAARRRSTRITRSTRLSTRANPTQDSGQEEEPNELKETDFAQLSSESDDSAQVSSEDEAGGGGRSKSSKSHKAKSASRSKKHKYDPRAKISADKVAAASDSFDLFFDGSSQLSLPQNNRKIGLAELQRACRVLKERFTDEDVSSSRFRSRSTSSHR